MAASTTALTVGEATVAEECPAAPGAPSGSALLQLAGARGRSKVEALGPDEVFQPPEPTGDDPVAPESQQKRAATPVLAESGSAKHVEAKHSGSGPGDVFEPPEPAGGDPVAPKVPEAQRTPASLAQQVPPCPGGYMEVAGRCTVRPATEAEVWVKSTNIYRCMHGAPPVTWSVAAAANAQSYVDTLTSMVHSSSYTLAPPAGPAGENLAMGFLFSEDAVAGWYSEVSCCQSWPGCETTSCTTGHFTALVWRGVTEIGCAVNGLDIYICRYRSGDTLGPQTANMRGYFVQNVLQQSKTAETCIQEIDGAATPTSASTTTAPPTTLAPTSTTTRPPTTLAPASTTTMAGSGLRIMSGPCAIDSSGCATSPNWPSTYGSNQACAIRVPVGVAVSAVSFNTELTWDKLRINGRDYSGTAGPQAVVPTADITWTSDVTVVSNGWRLCPASSSFTTTVRTTTTAPPAPAPAPAGSGLRVVSGPCAIDSSGCATSPNWPNMYSSSQSCTIGVSGGVAVNAVSFNTEQGWDKLRINGLDYSGTAGPQGVVPTADITWTTDSSVVSNGWRLCPGAAPPTTAAPSGTTTLSRATTLAPGTTLAPATTLAPVVLPTCTAAPDRSRALCETCVVNSQCAVGAFCCPYQKRCMSTTMTSPCPLSAGTPGANCPTRCLDAYCRNNNECLCPDCEFVGPGRTYDWFVWAQLRGTSTSGTWVQTCLAPGASPSQPPYNPGWADDLEKCTVDRQGCLLSPNFPAAYRNYDQCIIRVSSTFQVSSFSFNMGTGDVLRINGVAYQGSTGPAGITVSPGSSFFWFADASGTAPGFRLCPGAPSAMSSFVTTTTTTTPLPVCTAPADRSRYLCETCLTSAQCQVGQFCCPRMKKCVINSATPCYSPTADCSTNCADTSCSASGCSCTSCATAGPGKQFEWLVYANLMNSNSADTLTPPRAWCRAP